MNRTIGWNLWMLWALLLVLSLLVSACAAASAAVESGSNRPEEVQPMPSPGLGGVRGRVLIAPACPVERSGQPCPEQPYVGPIEVRDLGGKVVAEVSTDEHGRFSLELPPGVYVLVPVRAGVRGLTPDQQIRVEVQEGVYTEVEMRVDTGIRGPERRQGP